MEDSDITLAEYKREKKVMSKKKSGILTIFLIILLVASVLISGFIGKHFLNMFIFTIMFSFPILVIYRNQIAKRLPDSIADWIVDETEEVEADVKESVGDLTYPLYVKEYQILTLSIFCMLLSVYMLYKERTEFIGIMSSLFFAVTAGMLIAEEF
jgi:hypothetical protein